MLTLDNLNNKKSNSTQTLKTFQKLNYVLLCSKFTFDKSNSPCLEHFLFYPNNRLVPVQILSYGELNVVVPIFSLAIHKVLFSFSWLTILTLILKSTNS